MGGFVAHRGRVAKGRSGRYGARIRGALGAFVGLWLGVGALGLVSGCPGTLENPDRFDAGAGGGAAACDIPGTLIPQRCAISGCHTTMTAAGDLDLEAPDVGQRLVDVPAVGCTGMLVDSQDLEASVMYQVIVQDGTTCLPMPQVGAPLTAEEAQCFLDWLGTL